MSFNSEQPKSSTSAGNEKVKALAKALEINDETNDRSSYISNLYHSLSHFNYENEQEKFCYFLEKILSSDGNLSKEEEKFLQSYGIDISSGNITDSVVKVSANSTAVKNEEIKNEEMTDDEATTYDASEAYSIFDKFHECKSILGKLDMPRKKHVKFEAQLEKLSTKAVIEIEKQRKKAEKFEKKGKSYNVDTSSLDKISDEIDSIIRKAVNKYGDEDMYDDADKNETNLQDSNDNADDNYHEDDEGLEEANRKGSKKPLYIFIFILIIGVIGFLGYRYVYLPYANQIVVNESALTVELGEPYFPTMSSLFEKYPDGMEFDASDVNSMKIGKYEITTNDEYNGEKIFTVEVKDTTPPNVSLKYSIYQVRRKAQINPEDLIESVTDNNTDGNLKVYLDTDTFDKMGEYQVTLTVEDESGNKQTLTQDIEVVSQWAETLNHKKATQKDTQ